MANHETPQDYIQPDHAGPIHRPNTAENEPFDQDKGHDISYFSDEKDLPSQAEINQIDPVGNVRAITDAPSRRAANQPPRSVFKVGEQPEFIETEQDSEKSLQALDVPEPSRTRVGRFIDRIVFGEDEPVGIRVHHRTVRFDAALRHRQLVERQTEKFTRARR